MHRLLTLTLLAALLAQVAPAAAATFTGTLEKVYEPAPTEADPRRKVEVHRLQTAEGSIPLADLEPFAPLASLVNRGQLTLEGQLVDGRLVVERIAAPSLELFKGTVYRTRKGMSGQILIQFEGQEAGVKVSGLPWLAFRQLTEDLSRHLIEFEAFPVRDARGALSELVVTRVKAKASERLILTRNLLSYRGEVPAGESVWLVRRSLLGVSALVEGSRGQTGFALWDNLQIGEPVQPAKGATDRLNETR